MIELLIVISILGILAVAVLSAINPVEQINRGRDTASRGDAEQLINAIDRYNAFQGYYPWMTGQNDTTPGIDWIRVTDSAPTDGGTPDCPMMEKLGTAVSADCNETQELKDSFIERISATNANPLFIYNSGDVGASTYVCFRPRSKAFATEANTRASGTLPIDYPPDATGNTDPITGCGTDGNCICLP